MTASGHEWNAGAVREFRAVSGRLVAGSHLEIVQPECKLTSNKPPAATNLI
jgi:hypothetical protein